MKLTVIEDDGTTRIAKDATGEALYADSTDVESGSKSWWPIQEYSILQPGGTIVVPEGGRENWPYSVVAFSE